MPAKTTKTTRTRAKPKADKRAITSWGGVEPSLVYSSGLGLSQTVAGTTVTADNAESISAYYACINVIAQTIGTLPRNVTKKVGGKTVRDTDSDLYRVLNNPNDYQSAPVFWETIKKHVVNWGNGYAYIDRDNRGRLLGLYLLLPNVTKPFFAQNGNLHYETIVQNQKITLRPDQVFHVVGDTIDGIIGRPTFAVHARTLGIALSAAETTAKYMENGFMGNVVLRHPGTLKDDAAARVRISWNENYSGVKNAYKALVLEEGMTAEVMSISPEASQFFETKKFSVEEVARLLRVPLAKIGHPVSSGTYTNSEAEGKNFVQECILHWVCRLEAEIERKLIPPSERGTTSVRFALDGLMRGLRKERQEAYAIMLSNGTTTPNRINEEEGEEEIQFGDYVRLPTGASLGAPDGTILSLAQGIPAAPKSDPKAPEDKPPTAAAPDVEAVPEAPNGGEAESLAPVAADVARSLSVKEAKAFARLAKEPEADKRNAAVEAFLLEHEALVQTRFSAVAQSLKADPAALASGYMTLCRQQLEQRKGKPFTHDEWIKTAIDNYRTYYIQLRTTTNGNKQPT